MSFCPYRSARAPDSMAKKSMEMKVSCCQCTVCQRLSLTIHCNCSPERSAESWCSGGCGTLGGKGWSGCTGAVNISTLFQPITFNHDYDYDKYNVNIVKER